MGTKEYRKPEWVTHMEELQEALKGKTDYSFNNDLHESVASLNKLCSKPKWQCCSNVQYSQEPTNMNMQNARTFSLSMRRHSFNSVIELKAKLENRKHREVLKCYSCPNFPELYNSMQTDYSMHNVNYRPFASFLLSPIEEYSELSTRASSYKGSKDSMHDTYPCFSFSCDFLSMKCISAIESGTQKYQTFPRAKTDFLLNNPDYHMYKLNDIHRSPLNPREIDPFAYYQLHTIDSQEELQEFLLLESACMSDTKGSGLATAFCASKDNCN